MGNGSTDLHLAVKIDGVPDAQRVLSDLDKSLASVISSLNGGDRTDPNLPKRLGTYTTMASNGMGAYEIPGVSPETGAAALMSGNLLRNPSLLPGSGPAPAPNLDPMNTGGSYGTHTVGASASPFQTNGGAINVVIVGSSIPLGNGQGGAGNASASSPSNAPGGGQGGGNVGIPGGGVPTGTSGGGSTPATQGGGGGAGVPANGDNPFAAGGFNPFAPGGLSSFASKTLQYAQNPSALMAEIPSPLLLAGLGITTAAQAATANFAAYRPEYDLQTSLTSAQLGGQLINPALRPLQDKVAADKGDAAYYEAHRGTIYGLAGRIGSLGIADWFYSTRIQPAIARRTQEDEAELAADPMRLRFQAVTGVKPGKKDASLSVRNALLNSAGVFGTAALEALQSTSGFADMNVRGYSADDATSAVSTLYSAAQSQQSGSLYNNLASGKNPITLAQARASLPLLISQGNTSGIESLRPILPGSEVDAALTQSRQVFQIGVSGQIASAGFSEAGSAVSLLGATGGGYRSIAAHDHGRRAGAYDKGALVGWGVWHQ